MALHYTIQEAKRKFSELLRHMREGRTITVTYRGEAVAEIRPISKQQQILDERIAELIRIGDIIPASKSGKRFEPIAKRSGALRRFLEDRAY